MTYILYIGDRTFSSWSLRGWLMLEKFGLPYDVRMVGLYSGTMAADLAHIPPARTVPAMTTPEGYVLTDSLAMAETLVENHPDTALYPRDPAARALARSLCAEMHSGFGALRSACPCMISHVWQGFQPSAQVQDDLARIETL
ncbi:MAG: glutathione S-transferase N-terminal domain-containing protein, partial [Loktanella sp.]|nr:glutathione S-transferase N-terminal domain-containing protein [Loktanella sp.]